MARPVYGLLNSALGHNPDAERIVGGQDIASIAESVMTLGDGGGSQGIAAIGLGLGTTLLIASLLTPWLTGMLVASLRERRALKFGELWLGGWREYGRQFRLLLVALIPWAVVGLIAVGASFWARHGNDTRILESIGEQRNTIVMWVVGIAWLLAQLAVLVIWWMRIARLSALTSISPIPVESAAATLPSVDHDITPLPPTAPAAA